jgi:hypothetical protein
MAKLFFTKYEAVNALKGNVPERCDNSLTFTGISTGNIDRSLMLTSSIFLIVSFLIDAFSLRESRISSKGQFYWLFWCLMLYAKLYFVNSSIITTQQYNNTALTLPPHPTQRQLFTTSNLAFEMTSSHQSFVVPEGAFSMTVVLFGARGGCYGSGARAGRGAKVTGTFAVTSGTTYVAVVGGQGQDIGGGRKPGGYNGGLSFSLFYCAFLCLLC